MRMTDIIEHKKLNKELSYDEIDYFVSEYTKGNIPDYQVSALLMAIYFNSMNEKETARLTLDMANSGDVLNLDRFNNLTADKHSSGGVGDKTTLIVAPIAAAAGVIVAKMSGRGLGFTGGTIDKLESISGLNTSLTPEKFLAQGEKTGLVISGQTGNLAPCDKKLYALRDVTATVNSMPLIASSIMSKKIAAGAHNIVLDVKCGSGAFMENEKDAVALAKEMVTIGKNCGRNVSAFITDMSCPLGYAVGNSLEVIEAVEILKGKKVDDLVELSLNLSAKMISMAQNVSFDKALVTATKMLISGKAFDKLCEMVFEEGGDVSMLTDTEKFEKSKYSYDIISNEDGYITEIDALKVGKLSVLLGAGREVKNDSIDMSAGILLNKKRGDKVSKGEKVLTIFSSNKDKADSAKEYAYKVFKIGKVQPKSEKLIKEVITSD